MEHEAFLTREQQDGEEYAHDSIPEQHDRASETSTASLTLRDSNFARFFGSIFVLKFLAQFSSTLLELPLLRLIEQKVCRVYHGITVSNTIEAACKIPQVQNNLAYIVGIKLAFDALPCLLTALFYGHLSDVRGRRFVMSMSTTGQALALFWILTVCTTDYISTELVWIASFLLLIGGGVRLELCMQYISFCDVVPWRQRTGLLSYLHVSDGIAGLLGYPIGYVLMKRQVWYPFAVVFTIHIVKLIVIYYLRETSSSLNRNITKDTSPYVSEQRMTLHEDLVLSSAHAHALIPESSFESYSGIFHPQPPISRLRAYFKHQGLRVIFICFLLKRVGFASEGFLGQYGSEILSRDLSETFWLRMSAHIGQLLTLGVFIPIFTRKLSCPSKDIWVIFASLTNVIAGYSVIWRGRTLVILCLGQATTGLGEGFELGLQTLGSYIVGEANFTTFFPLASMLGVAGELIGGPVMAWLYAFRSEDQFPAGYCFLFSIIIFSGLFIGSCFVKTNLV